MPERSKQAAVTDRLDAERELQQQTGRELARLASLLEERKRALITACVTGEFDVTAASDRAADAALAGGLR